MSWAARPIHCLFCGSSLDPAQEFTVWVELQNEDDPAYLDVIRKLPHAAGQPLIICRRCQESVEINRSGLTADDERDRRIEGRIRGVSLGCLIAAVSFPFVVVAVQIIKDRLSE